MENTQPFRKILFLLSFLLLFSFGNAQVTQAWVRSYEGLPDIDYPVTTRLAVDGAGNVITAGQNFVSQFNVDLIVTKYDAAGNVLWIRRSQSADFVRDLTVDAAGNIYVTGEGAFNGLFDYVTIKYDAAGNELWTKVLAGPNTDVPVSIAVDASGNVYVTGTSLGGIETQEDFATVKYDAAGNELWVKRYDGPDHAEDRATALGVDASGNVYVIGVSNGAFVIVKYDTNGNLLWEKGHSGFSGRDLAVDPAGNVYVAGSALIKYDTNGNELWVRTDGGQALALDAAGNVYVTGGSVGSGTSVDFATIKYSAAGDQLWVNRYNGPANGVDSPVDLAVDASGNVYVTGGSDGIGTNIDIATVKYDAVGNEAWVIRYNGPGNRFDVVNDIAVDGTGNVFVTGASYFEARDQDYITIKYTQITVTDVSCGKKGDKVLVCHKGKTLCISPNAVDAHLKHGDQLGSCNSSPDLNSITERTDISPLTEEGPQRFLVAVAPNPLNTMMRLQYELPSDGEISIKVYDVIGREVATVVKAVQKAGVYNASFNATDMAKGVYYYRALLTTQQKMYTQTGKLIIVK
jgi:hypothetical protein